MKRITARVLSKLGRIFFGESGNRKGVSKVPGTSNQHRPKNAMRSRKGGKKKKLPEKLQFVVKVDLDTLLKIEQ